jgi:hypothetical protein
MSSPTFSFALRGFVNPSRPRSRWLDPFRLAIAAVLVLDNPRDPEIPRLVSAGYFIRTRADSDLHIDRSGKTSSREAALASGAQIVSTDFPAGEPQVGNGYMVEFAKSAAARVNPINGPEASRGQTLAQ